MNLLAQFESQIATFIEVITHFKFLSAYRAQQLKRIQLSSGLKINTIVNIT